MRQAALQWQRPRVGLRRLGLLRVRLLLELRLGAARGGPRVWRRVGGGRGGGGDGGRGRRGGALALQGRAGGAAGRAARRPHGAGARRGGRVLGRAGGGGGGAPRGAAHRAQRAPGPPGAPGGGQRVAQPGRRGARACAPAPGAPLRAGVPHRPGRAHRQGRGGDARAPHPRGPEGGGGARAEARRHLQVGRVLGERAAHAHRGGGVHADRVRAGARRDHGPLCGRGGRGH
mmetsp:Transcript_14954/g.37290  ORF Transcript_14954/g.37290 Transcript_14954/m.37290 type:complete len:231 (-) Transcript_14954:2961-3653(-)